MTVTDKSSGIRVINQTRLEREERERFPIILAAAIIALLWLRAIEGHMRSKAVGGALQTALGDFGITRHEKLSQE